MIGIFLLDTDCTNGEVSVEESMRLGKTPVATDATAGLTMELAMLDKDVGVKRWSGLAYSLWTVSDFICRGGVATRLSH